MLIELQVLFKDGNDDIDYDAMGLTPPEEILEFLPLMVNTDHIAYFDRAESEKESILYMSTGKHLQCNLSYKQLTTLITNKNINTSKAT